MGQPMRILVALVCVLLLGGAAGAQTAKDFDLSCAVVATAEIATNQKGTKERDVAFTVLSFYLGRLSARDDKTYWGAVIKGRIAELREGAKSESLYTSCMSFYTSKME
jgi:hypothetical protein